VLCALGRRLRCLSRRTNSSAGSRRTLLDPDAADGCDGCDVCDGCCEVAGLGAAPKKARRSCLGAAFFIFGGAIGRGGRMPDGGGAGLWLDGARGANACGEVAESKDRMSNGRVTSHSSSEHPRQPSSLPARVARRTTPRSATPMRRALDLARPRSSRRVLSRPAPPVYRARAKVRHIHSPPHSAPFRSAVPRVHAGLLHPSPLVAPPGVGARTRWPTSHCRVPSSSPTISPPPPPLRAAVPLRVTAYCVASNHTPSALLSTCLR
jgi:hypothetical protein